MKRILLVFLVLCLVCPFTAVYASEPELQYDSVVTGTGKPEIDVTSVQEAANKGGKILLKGRFNFGNKGQVSITKDIEIYGETDSNGKPLTKLSGGFWTLHSQLPTTELPLPGPGPRITIKHIHFEGATWSPLHFPYVSGAEISENKITGLKPFVLPIKWKGGDSILAVTGIALGTRFAHKEKLLPGAVTGNLIIENNFIDLKCENPRMTMGHGIFFPWTWGASIEVRNNKIRNASRNAIEALDNYIDEDGKGSISIIGNNIITPQDGCPFPGPTSYPNGIVFGWFFDRSGSSDSSKNSKITIFRNFVQANGELSTGITSMADGAAILGNRIQLKSGQGARGITQLGSNGFIARNQIDGKGKIALCSVAWKEFKGSRNIFAWNDLRQFEAIQSDIICTGDENTFIGSDSKIEDIGKENKNLVIH